MAAKFPLLVQLEYYVGSKDANDTADWLQSKFNDDPAVPGIRIPIYFTPDDGSGAPPQPSIATEAEQVMVVVLADDYLAAKAHEITKSGITWADYILNLRQLCDAKPENRFVPVQLTKHGWPIDARLSDLSIIRAYEEDGLECCQLIARRLANMLIRQLRGYPDDSKSPPVTIFLSHTKLDLDNAPHVVRTLLEYLTAEQPERTWFDSGDIEAGSRFQEAIEDGVSDAALLAVQTDLYSSRSWCRREVLFAKYKQRPVVVVDAIQKREIRRFPYAGNTPVIRWNGDPKEVVDLLLLETLRHTYAEKSLEQQRREGDDILPVSPELVTIINRKSDAILYPDPPVGPEEQAVLSAVKAKIQTPLERYACEKDLHARSLIVALSVSDAEDLTKFGLRKAHLLNIMLELSRYLLLTEVRLAYGGNMGPESYTLRLADLLRDPIVEQLRGEPSREIPLPPELIIYIPWPTPQNVEDEAKLGILVEKRRCDRPADIDETLDPAFVTHPKEEIPIDSPIHRFGRSRGLTVMRERQTVEADARIIVGGRKDPGYEGRMPGVLEEALLSIRAKLPLYLVGAFGGGARLVIDALEGIPRSELTWKYQSTSDYSSELRQIYQERECTWDEFEEIFAFLRDSGYASLNNGLTEEENRELATTRSGDRIVELLFLGLGRRTS